LHWRQLLTEAHIGAAVQRVGAEGDAVPVGIYLHDAATPADERSLHWIHGCGVWDLIDERSQERPCAEHTHQLLARALVRCSTMSTAGPLGAWSLTVWPLTTEVGDQRPQGALVMLGPAHRQPENLAATVQERFGVTLNDQELGAATAQLKRARAAAAPVRATLTDLAADIVQQLTAEQVVAGRGGPLGAPWDVSQLRQIVKAMGSGLVVTDPQGVVELCNPKARALLGAELEGTALAERFEASSTVTSALDASRTADDTAEGDASVSIEVTAEVAGQPRLFSLVITPIRVGAVVSGLVVVIRDMTRARDLDTLREDFLASVNHELRTPLATLRGVATTLKDEPDMELGDRTEFLAILDREARRVAVLVEDMLAMTRLDARQAPLVTHRLDLQVHLAELVGSFRAECDAARISLDVVVPDETVWVAANAGLLSQLGHNLVGNALKFAPDGGHIGLTVALDGQDAVRLEVSDDGPGLSAEDQRTAFQRFYRSSRAARVVTGSGLGLSLVKRIADAHGWTVALSSEPGSGTTVSVVIPRMPEGVE